MPVVGLQANGKRAKFRKTVRGEQMSPPPHPACRKHPYT